MHIPHMTLGTLRVLSKIVRAEMQGREYQDTVWKGLSDLQIVLGIELAQRTAEVNAQYAYRMSEENLDGLFDKIYQRFGSGLIGARSLMDYIGTDNVRHLLALGFLNETEDGWLTYRHPYV